MHLSADFDTWHHSASSRLPWVSFVHSNITIIHHTQCRNPQRALLIHSAWRCPLQSYSCVLLHYGFWLSISPYNSKPPTKSRTWVKVLDLSDTLLWLHLLCLPSTASPDCPASQRNTVNRGNPTPQWTTVETPGAPLSVYLGYCMCWLHQEELTWFRNLIWEKPKAPDTWSWKAAAAWELGRRTEMFKVFTGAAAGPQDTEQHRWTTLRQVLLHNIPVQRLRRLKQMLRAQRQSTNAWPPALSPAQVTFIPQQPAESWKGRWSLPSQLQTCFFLRTQQVITQQGKRCLGTMQSKEVLKFHHGVFASLRDKKDQTRLNRRGTGRDFNTFSNIGTELSLQDLC